MEELIKRDIHADIAEIRLNLQIITKIINILLPNDSVDIKYIAEKTGKTRQAIRYNLLNNYKQDLDYFYSVNGKIKCSANTALKIMLEKGA